MAKRPTSFNNKHKSTGHKTKKRLAIKREKLIELASKKRRHNRIVRSLSSK